MISNMNFYSFMHKQILILIALSIGTGLGYLYIGYFYSSVYQEIIWYTIILIVSIWGYKLHLYYKNNDLNLKQKDDWLKQLNFFIFIYFSLWTIIFVMYVTRDDIHFHYIALATQYGTGVVSATVLVSQRKLATATLISVMLPIFVYFIFVNEFYSYLLAFFTFILSWVLHYASSNTYDYIVKSHFQAYNDYLTTLGNRRYFIEILEDAIKVQKTNGQYIYIFLIDLDHFKIINDTLGHDIGDELLIEVSKRLKKLSNEFNAKVSRLGGDEFCVLSSFYKNEKQCRQDAKEFAYTLLNNIKKQYNINDNKLYISASVGVSFINTPNLTASTLIKEADIAMYEAKNKGRNGVIFFSDDLNKKIQYKSQVERLLHFAIKNDELSLKFQAKLNTNTNEISCEVLTRWNNKQLGQVSPDDFILIAEQSGLIVYMGDYIIKQSFKVLKQWSLNNIGLIQMSINISMKQILHRNFIHRIEKLSKNYLGDDLLTQVTFEITETSAPENMELLIENIKALKKMGIKVSMDDFGTGYSSLNSLHQLSLDELKIDKSFIQEINNKNNNSNQMIKTILDLSRNLNISVVAEGVETLEQIEFLKDNGCYILQGNYFAKPLTKSEFEIYILNKRT